MSRCNPAARWGPGTTCERPVNSANSRELESQLAAMRTARDSVDKMWSGGGVAAAAPKPKPTERITAPENKSWITFRSSN
jgi:hypothetical protein